MKPQDIVILLKLLIVESTEWRYEALAKALHMSSSTIFSALKRSEIAGLYHKNSKTVNRVALLEIFTFRIEICIPCGRRQIGKGHSNCSFC